ncbi:MAG: hypothetical protein FWF87_04230 [Synergistaceae bacterium]|nr:hypothetical protein [Synergistaceae bacterium]
MINKYFNNGNIDIMNAERAPGVNTSRWLLFLALSITLAFLLISFSSASVLAAPEISEEQEELASDITGLHRTKNSGRVLWELNIATASGVARIPEDTPQGRLLGRRGALTDARRNLLILRKKLLKDPNFDGENAKKNSVSGKIAGVVIHSERINNNLYFLQVDIPLDKLMEGVVEIEIEIEQ